MYLAVIPARRLVDHTTIDHWSPGRPTGYQRVETTTHVNQIAKFLHQPDAILPLPGILNVRVKNRIHFRGQGDGSIASGTISIDDGTDIYVVDMQHRREGLRRAYEQLEHLGDFPVPVVIIEGLTPVDETLQFYLVNQKSKRISSDLALRILLERLNDERFAETVGPVGWRSSALGITILLNKDIRNPWKGRIKEPNTPKNDHHVATEKSFVPSLRPVVSFPPYARLGKQRLAAILAGYWNGIGALFPLAFRNPDDHVIMSVTSYVAFHRLLPLVIPTAKNAARPWNTTDAEARTLERLAPLRDLTDSFWDRTANDGAARFGAGFGAGGRLFTFLADTASLLSES